MIRRAWWRLLLVVLSFTGAHCGSSTPPIPGSPSTIPPAAPQPNPPAAPQPAPPVTRTQPSVTRITPSIGSTGGETWGTLTGAGFVTGTTLHLGEAATIAVMSDSTTILFWTKGPHAAGSVDVVVTNPGGLTATLASAFTFASPETFDLNGDWLAHAGPDYEIDMGFTIRNNALVSLSCGTSVVTLPSPVGVGGGSFSLVLDGVGTVSARLVSPSTAAGTIDVEGCPRAAWWGEKSGAAVSRR
ncbi:MAG: IPT/TIG domain-containing protein [Acidobacteriota bacterium]